MKKTLIAMAVAAIAAAPIAAQADAVIYGTVAVDFMDIEVAGASNSEVERDDTVFGIKASSETDAGLNVSGEIKTEGTFSSPTLAYVAVDNGTVKLWAGKFGQPADAADSADFSATGNKTHFAGELDNAVAVTVNAGGLSASVGTFQAEATATADSDGTTASLGYAAGGFSGVVGFQQLDGRTDTVGLKLGYAADMFSVNVYNVTTETDGASNEIDTVGINGSVKMGMTTVSAIVAQDDYEGIGEDDVFGLKVSHGLGGGLTTYAEYGNTDGDKTNDHKSIVLGMSYSF